jgi:hypothetical protein
MFVAELRRAERISKLVRQVGNPAPLPSIQDDIRDLLNAILADHERVYLTFKSPLT